MQSQNRFFDDIARVASGAVGAISGVRGEIEPRLRDQLERVLAGYGSGQPRGVRSRQGDGGQGARGAGSAAGAGSRSSKGTLAGARQNARREATPSIA